MIDKLLGHYRIITKLGEGGMGVVYRAHDEVLQRDVAIKVVGEALAAEARSVLLREARAASALNHPNVCIVHEVNETDGVFYLVMELVEGATLNSLIPERGLPFQTVMRYGVQIASALAHAHGRNIAHRDLKSHNVVVTPEGLIKVLDFGLARRLVASYDETQSMRALESASTGGTLSYMSPEVLRGEPGDHRSDLWALGVLLYEAAAGEAPFQGRTAFELSSKIMSEPPPTLAGSIPSGLAAIIQRCLAKEPAQRYQRAERSSSGARGSPVGCRYWDGSFDRSATASHYRASRDQASFREEWRCPAAGWHNEGAIPVALQRQASSLGCGGSVFPWAGNLRARL